MALIASALVSVCGCKHENTSPPPPRQNSNLKHDLTGWLATKTDNQGIIVYSLPDLRRTMVLPDRNPGDVRAVFALSGPDSRGRIAYIESNSNAEKRPTYSLKLIDRDNPHSQQTLFTGIGDPIWQHVISESLSLSASGNVALLCNLQSVQLKGVLLYEGALEICDVHEGTKQVFIPAALDAGLSWSSNGRQLAFVALTPVSQVPHFDPNDRAWVEDSSNRVPAVCVLDLETRESKPLCVGRLPVVSEDGRFVMSFDRQGRLQRTDISTGQIDQVSLPFGGMPIYMRGDGLAIYEGSQTEGEPTFTKYYSPLAGRRPLASIKVGIANTAEFQTLIPSFDFRNPISYGP